MSSLGVRRLVFNRMSCMELQLFRRMLQRRLTVKFQRYFLSTSPSSSSALLGDRWWLHLNFWVNSSSFKCTRYKTCVDPPAAFRLVLYKLTFTLQFCRPAGTKCLEEMMAGSLAPILSDFESPLLSNWVKSITFSSCVFRRKSDRDLFANNNTS